MNRSELIDQLMEHLLAEQLEADAAADAFGPSPSDLAFSRWQQHTSLWRTITETIRELTAEITILVGKSIATFDALPLLLRPQLAPAPVQRSVVKRSVAIGAAPDPTPQAAELLELPHPEANLLIRVNIASVVDGQGSLALEVRRMTPAQPIEQARITLRDQENDLIERTATDADGLATFAKLPVGKYAVAVEQAGQTWRFGLTLKVPNGDTR